MGDPHGSFGSGSLGTNKVMEGSMKKQELIDSIVEILKSRSTASEIYFGSLTRDQLSWLTVYQLRGYPRPAWG